MHPPTSDEEAQMGTVISVINLKGGVGKTTLVVCFGEFLGFVLNKRVLLIDMDHQTNLTYAMISRETLGMCKESGKTIYHMFKNALDGKNWSMRDAIINDCSNIEGNLHLRLIASLPDVGHLDEMILEQYENKSGFTALDARRMLREKLEDVKKEFEYIIIDCPPSLGLPTINALLASDYFVVPVVPEFLSLQGLDLIMRRVTGLKDRYGAEVEFGGTILNKISVQRSDHKEWSEVLFLSPEEKAQCRRDLEAFVELLRQGKHERAAKIDIQRLRYALILRELRDTDFRPFTCWLGDLKPFYLITDYGYMERKGKARYSAIEKKYKGVGSAPDRDKWPKLGRGPKHYDLFQRCKEMTQELIERCQ